MCIRDSDNLSDDEKERLMDELVGAITKLSEDQTGALITFERRQSLIDYINTGTKINADIKAELFTTIFWEGTPLHDGATIIKGDRVVCAAAFYPPTNQELSPLYGARHRAALGLSLIHILLCREEIMTTNLLDTNKVYPVVDINGSDSAMLDNTLEFLVKMCIRDRFCEPRYD